MTETLTDEERNMLDDIAPIYGGKALRIIDQLTRERDEALENASVAAREMSRCHRLWQEDKVTLEQLKALNKSNADVEARSQARLVAEVARLTEALAAAESQKREHEQCWLAAEREGMAAEARVRELAERVEFWQGAHEGLKTLVSKALENPTTVEGLRAAVLEALRG